MSATPEPPGSNSSRLRRWLITGMVIGIVGIVIAVAATWYFFYGGEAPEAPTIDNALKILLPSASPE